MPPILLAHLIHIVLYLIVAMAIIAAIVGVAEFIKFMLQ